MAKRRSKSWLMGVFFLFSLILVAAGAGAGILAYRALMPQESAPDPASSVVPAEAAQVHMSRTAFQNLGIKLGKVERLDFMRTVTIPCQVVEQPGKSTIRIAAPVTGVVTRVYVLEGQALSPNDKLFDVTVTDEELTSAQLELLDAKTQLQVLAAELKRLTPATESGAVPGVRKLELDYQKMRWEAKRLLRLQQLRARGLDEAEISQIENEAKLIREVTVRLGDRLNTLAAPQSLAGISDSGPIPVTTSDPMQYSMEELAVHPGSAVELGEQLCDVSYHTTLLVQGQAFENDIENIATLRERGWHVAVELGLEGYEIVREGLDVLFVDNHVDADTQTFPFYIALVNEVVTDNQDSDGRIFRSWRFKPGQRGHVKVPVERLEQQLVLPLKAVVREGPEAFVFRRVGTWSVHRHNGVETVEIHFEPVAVRVLKEDGDRVVVSDEGELNIGDTVAMNQAYELNLTYKVQMGQGDDGHGHPH